MIVLNLPVVCFGAVSAIITSIGLIVGFGAAGLSNATVIAGLLIIGLADNLTDSLSIHIYQESERLEERAAFKATLGNFATRLAVSLSFVALVLALPDASAVLASLAWGVFLMTGLTWRIAKNRGANVIVEILKHLGVAILVVGVSSAIGALINTYIH